MPPPTLLIAPDSFKDFLSAREVALAMAAGIERAWPQARLRLLPLSDGGDGLLGVIETALSAERRTATVEGPTGEPLEVSWLFETAARRAWIAADEVVPLSKVGPDLLHRATTHGVGQLIRLAQAAGAERVLVGIGGTGTIDGGAGALAGLGCELRARRGSAAHGGLDLLRELTAVGPSPEDLPEIELICDVQSPLVGPRGAAHLYGPQKGLEPQDIPAADRQLAAWARLLDEGFGCDPALMPFAGAGGGLAAGLMIGAGAVPRDGARRVAELVGLEVAMSEAMIVVTGEGQVDAQSAEGKVLSYVLELASEIGRPVQVIAGTIDAQGRAWLTQRGARGAQVTPEDWPLSQARHRAAELVEAAAYEAFVG